MGEAGGNDGETKGETEGNRGENGGEMGGKRGGSGGVLRESGGVAGLPWTYTEAHGARGEVSFLEKYSARGILGI